LNNRAIFAVSVAIVIGITVAILLFSSLSISPPAASATTKDGSLQFTILDLNDSYAIDEPLNFSVHIRGHGYFCSDPIAKILDAKSRQLVYDIPEGDFLVFCRPESRDIDYNLRLEDLMSPYNPLVLGEPGRYVLVIDFGGASVEKEFTVRPEALAK
jgi:hypothetical protein